MTDAVTEIFDGIRDFTKTEEFKINALITLLIDKKIITKEEFNNTLTEQSNNLQKSETEDEINSIKRNTESVLID